MRVRLLLLLSASTAIVYLVTAPWQPFAGSAWIKGCAVGGLAARAMLARRERHDAGLLAAALGLSTAGDILLALNPSYFVFGLCAFLLAHIAYIFLFVRNRSGKANARQVAAISAVLIYSAVLSAWIVPSVGALAIPVILYICALTAMVSTAILAGFKCRWVAAGAVLFLVSDSLLAINRFKAPVPLRDYLVWCTYYLGQCGIALGYVASL